MASTLPLKRKNIDLPADTLRKLSIMVAASGKSLKKFIETVLITKADSLTVEVHENPSPSGDEWFDDPANLAEVMEGVRQHKAGKGRVYTIDELHEMLGV